MESFGVKLVETQKRKTFYQQKSLSIPGRHHFLFNIRENGKPGQKMKLFSINFPQPTCRREGEEDGLSGEKFFLRSLILKVERSENAKRLPKCNPNQGGHKSCWHIERKLEIGKVVAVGKLLLMDWDWQKIMLREKRNRESYFFCC